MVHSQKNMLQVEKRTQLEKWVTVKKIVTLRKNGSELKKIDTVRKMCHS